MKKCIIEPTESWSFDMSSDSNRLSTPHAGDVIRFPKDIRRYPVKNEFCRIVSIDETSQIAHVVDGIGSSFILESGCLRVLDEPSFSMPIKQLRPAMFLHATRVENKDEDVDYTIERPVFSVLAYPDEHYGSA